MDDLISRQALMKEFSDFVRASNNSDFAKAPTWNDAVSLVGSMPSAQRWIPCSERLPELEIDEDAVVSVQEYFVTVKEKWPWEEEWKYNTDIAEFPGDYIDDVWQTYNDWKEGQDVHVIAWMPLPEPYKEERE